TDEECCLSPSDFGFHNFLLVEDGSLRFIDFEYAGWDDPAKLACDFCSQPELPVPPALAQFFIEGLSAVSSEPDSLKLRINLLLPVYRIKWCFIILNDFLPESDRRRAFAGSDSPDRRRRIQLQKAEKYLKA
ncbi:MAG: hypothetical protein KAR13_07260, partial [Desulfobulbaceae bacterium]|nr:hypothetical protein [Desulfobulbaceae bacterium]